MRLTGLKEFLKELGTWIELYVLQCISREPIYHWNLNGSEAARAVETLRRHAVSEGLMTALRVEYVKDRRTLMRFLEAVFKRWREVDQPNSLWRVRLIAQQHLGKPKVVAQYVENTGAVSKCTNKSHFESLRAKLSNIAREIGKTLWKNAKRRGDRKRVALAEIVTPILLHEQTIVTLLLSDGIFGRHDRRAAQPIKQLPR
jgi:hypothetical protein